MNSHSVNNHSLLDQSLKDVVLLMEQAAIKAARLVLKKLEQGAALSSWRKADDTVVTEADIEAQALLVAELKGTLPLVCEEDPASHRLVETEDSYIVIDPLDGTTSARRFGIGTGGQVGYGPIIGLVQHGRIRAAVFVHIPMRQAFSAILGHGCETFSIEKELTNRVKLDKVEDVTIEKSALLFYAGKHGELDALAKLRRYCALENYYRFGGFANDAVRVALNLEQLQLQFSVKAWDLPAVLFPHEVGCRVLIDPLGKAIDLADYRPCLENPLLLGQNKLIELVLPLLRAK